MSPALRRLWPLAVILAGLAAVWALGLGDRLSFAALERDREHLRGLVDAHPVTAPLLFAVIYAAAVALSVPGAVWLTLAGGFLFGTWLGGTLAVVGATAGATVIFLVARTALAQTLRERAGPAVQRMAKGFDEGAFSYLLILRLVPVFPFWLVNIVPGLLGVGTVSYVAATFLGILPATYVYAGIGHGLGAVFDAGGEPDLRILARPEVIWPILGIVALALVPLVWRRWRARRGQPSA